MEIRLSVFAWIPFAFMVMTVFFMTVLGGCTYTPQKTVMYEPMKRHQSQVKDETPPKIFVFSPKVEAGRGIAVFPAGSNTTIRGSVVDAGHVTDFRIDGERVALSRDGSFSHTIKVRLAKNRFNLMAVDDANNIAQREIIINGTMLTYPPPPSATQYYNQQQSYAVVRPDPFQTPQQPQPHFKPRLFVLSVGVSNYKDAKLNLGYAAADATSLARALQNQTRRIFKKVEVHVLTNERATRTNILNAMSSFLGQAVSTDVVVIFVAGHGIKKEDTGSFFFLPHLANEDNLLDQGLSWYAFEEAINSLKQRVRNIVLILDTCHSGAMKIAMRGIKAGQDLSRSFARKGFYTLAAAYPNEGAMERKDWGHGAFTYAILEGLKGKADVNSDRQVDVIELFHYVEARVAGLTDGRQHPHFHMGGSSLPLAALP